MPSVPSITNRSKILSACLVLFIFFLPLLSFSQQREAEVKKFSPVLREGTTVKDAEQFSSFVIAVSDTDAFKTFIRNNTRISTIYQYPAVNVFLVRATWKDMREKILPRPEVLFIDEQRKP